jgi:hypothetical protein
MNKYEILSLGAGSFSYLCHTLFMHLPKFTKRMHACCVAISSFCGIISAYGIYNGGQLATETFWFLSALWGILKTKKLSEHAQKYAKQIKFTLAIMFSLYAYTTISGGDKNANWYEISSLSAGIFIYICYTTFLNSPKFTKRMYSVCVCIGSILYIIGAIGIRNRGVLLTEMFWLCVGIWGFIRNKTPEEVL